MADSSLFQLQLRASDLERSARFYRDLIGIGLTAGDPLPPANEPHYEASWGTWGSDSFTLFLIFPPRDGVHTSGATVGISVSDLHALHARALASEVPVVEPPHEEPWGRNAKYADPDGNVVTVSELPAPS